MSKGVLVDTNIILDVVTEDEQWFDWSSKQLKRQSNNNHLFINPIIYAEVSCGFDRIEEVDQVLSEEFYHRLEIPWTASFLAGKAFIKYKKKGGKKNSVLSDFFIGAHAVVNDLALLTRDGATYEYYFPKIELIRPG